MSDTVEALFVLADGTRERHPVDARRDVWQEYRWPNGKPTLAGLDGGERATVVNFRREAHWYSDEW